MLKGLIKKGEVSIEEESVVRLPIADIQPNPRQPRRVFDETALAELAASIKEHGVQQPLIVTPNPSGGYWLIAGERRLRASGLAGLATVPCIVRDATDQQMAVLALIENVQRADLNAMEEAHAYETLQQEHGMTQEQIASQVGKSRSTVANTLRLLDLPGEIQIMVSSGHLSASTAAMLLRLSDPVQSITLAADIVAKGLNRREVEERVNHLAGRERTKPAANGHAVKWSPVPTTSSPVEAKPERAAAIMAPTVTKNYVSPMPAMPAPMSAPPAPAEQAPATKAEGWIIREKKSGGYISSLTLGKYTIKVETVTAGGDTANCDHGWCIMVMSDGFELMLATGYCNGHQLAERIVRGVVQMMEGC